jgi:hypothetical protein
MLSYVSILILLVVSEKMYPFLFEITYCTIREIRLKYFHAELQYKIPQHSQMEYSDWPTGKTLNVLILHASYKERIWNNDNAKISA